MRIAFDIKLMRPGCVVIQAAFGCSASAAKKFNPQDWLTASTPDMGVYEVTPDQLTFLVKKVEESHFAGRKEDYSE